VLVKPHHTTVPAEGGFDDLPQCQLNKQIRDDVRLALLLADAKGRLGGPSDGEASSLVWAPERVLGEWKSLKGASWLGEFGEELKSVMPISERTPLGPFLRTVSDGLSFPMTILAALELLNGESAEWTKKEVLSVHVSELVISFSMHAHAFADSWG